MLGSGFGVLEVVVSLVEDGFASLVVGSGLGALEVVDSTAGVSEVVGAGTCSIVVSAGVLATSVLTGIASALSHATSKGVPTVSAVMRERVDFLSPKMRPFGVEQPAPELG